MVVRHAMRRFSTVGRSGLISSVAVLLTGCATLPTTGPTGHQVRRDVLGSDNAYGYKIVDITPDTASVPESATGELTLSSLSADGRVDVLGPGDMVSIEVFEVGSGLFAGGRTTIGGDGDTSGSMEPPSASGKSLGGGVTVGQDGFISVPYVGRLQVAGLTTGEVQDKILLGLRGKSQSPQVIVSIAKNRTNTVVVMGAVAKPGRLELTLARDHLLDAIAEAGGLNTAVTSGTSTATGTGPQDMIVRFTRGGRTVSEQLDTIETGSPDDLKLLPGDRIDVLRQPRTFIVFGATDKIAQLPFESARLSLAEALARIGGPSDARADPRSIFVFRLQHPVVASSTTTGAAAPKAVIYRLNMMKASGYFLSQRFAMQDKDVIYIANASSNLPAKAVQIINQLFAPIFSIRSVTN